MKRLALIAVLLAFSATQVATAKEDKRGRPEARPDAPVVKMAPRNSPPVRQFPSTRQQRTFTNVPPQSFGSQQVRRSSDFNSEMRLQPRADRSFGRRIASIEPTVPAVRPNVAPVIATNTVQQTGVAIGRGGNIDGRNRIGTERGNGSGANETGNWRHNENATGDRHGDHEGRRGNWRERHQEFHNDHEGDPNFSQAHRRWHRQHQSRNWWRSHYSRFSLFGGGYYYWNSGYWYPAYGYDPYFSTYSYNAPIYSYGDLEPGQIVANVQVELQRRGYNPGGVDGQYGPMTRRALLNYQGDNGLPVTGEIDESTLDSLGLQ